MCSFNVVYSILTGVAIDCRVHSSREEDRTSVRANTSLLRDYSLLLAYNTSVSVQRTQTFTSNSVLPQLCDAVTVPLIHLAAS